MKIKTVLLCAVLAAAGCNKNDDASATPAAPEQPSAPPPAPAAPAAPAPAPAAAAPAPAAQPTAAAAEPAAQPSAATAAAQPSAAGKADVEVHIGVSASAMAFDVTKIAAKPGQSVHVVLENKGPGVLPHNWALVKAGSEAAVAAAGLKAGAALGYIAEGQDMLAHTEMVQPGKTGEVTFNAPAEPGKYPYICTFPGHYVMMKGVLEVAP